MMAASQHAVLCVQRYAPSYLEVRAYCSEAEKPHPGSSGSAPPPPAGNPHPGLTPRSTLHRAPVGQGPSGPGWLAIAFGFWSGRALATGTAWAGL